MQRVKMVQYTDYDQECKHLCKWLKSNTGGTDSFSLSCLGFLLKPTLFFFHKSEYVPMDCSLIWSDSILSTHEESWIKITTHSCYYPLNHRQQFYLFTMYYYCDLYQWFKNRCIIYKHTIDKLQSSYLIHVHTRKI